MTTPETPGPYPYGLLWGIKASFLTYINRMPDGRGSATDGAQVVETNIVECFFPHDPEASASGEATWAFGGDVRFAGHANMLFVRIAQPRLEPREDHFVLSIAPMYPDDTERIELVRVKLERGDQHPGVDVWHSTEVLLTRAGVEVFNDVYPEGEPFEKFTMHVPSGADAQ